MSEKCKVSVVITVFENIEETLLCIESLSKSNYRNFEILLVMNSAVNDRQIQEYYRLSNEIPCRIFQQSKNTGAALGRNIGAAHSCGDYILFLDSDNLVSSNLISHLYELLENDPSLGLVGPLMLHHTNPNLVWLAGANISSWTCIASYNDNLLDITEVREVSRVTGHIPNCFMIRAIDFYKIGGFKEIYFIMYEEADLAARVSKNLGLKILLSYKCQTYHMVEIPKKQGLFNRIKNIGLSTPVRLFLTTRNRLIYAVHNFSIIQCLVFNLFFAPAATIVYFLSTLLAGNFHGSNAVLKGYISGIIYSLKLIIILTPSSVENIKNNISVEK